MEESGSLAIGIALAVLGSVNLNVGKGIQKWKVRVLGRGKAMFSAPYRRDLGIWLIGIALTASCTVIYSLALKFTDKAALVSSLNGVGMIGLVLFAWFVLRERIGGQELAGAALVLAGTVVMGLFNRPLAGVQKYELAGFIVTTGLILGFFGALGVYAWKTNRWFGFAFGALPGILIGTAMILADMALIKSQNDMMGQLKNPFPYLALLCATGALVITQLAFWRSSAMVVVPTINSFVILTPAAIEYFAFKTALDPRQYLGIAAIVAGVILLTATEKQDRLAGEIKKADPDPAGMKPGR